VPWKSTSPVCFILDTVAAITLSEAHERLVL
jgi:hypothetical protein